MLKLRTLFCLCALAIPMAYAAPKSDSERIAQLEQQVARLTEQVNRLLAERVNEYSDYRRERNYPMYSCRLKAFTDTFHAQNANRGKARLSVAQQCRHKHNAMFCQEKDVVCETYQ